MEKRPFFTTPVPEQVQQKWKQEKQVLLLAENPKVEAVMRQSHSIFQYSPLYALKIWQGDKMELKPLYPNLKHIYLKGRISVMIYLMKRSRSR